MKKALIVLLTLLVAGGLFAQTAPGFTLQGRVDTWWIPFQVVTTDVDAPTAEDPNRTKSETLLGAGLGRDNMGNVGTRARLYGAASGENFGLRIQLHFFPAAMGPSPGTNDTTAIRIGDFAGVWWSPVPQFTIEAGRFIHDTLRGAIGDSWTRQFTVGSYGPDEIFTRFNSEGAFGTRTSNIGVLGHARFGDFYMGILFPGLNGFTRSQRNPILDQGGVPQTVRYDSGLNEFMRVYERTQIAFGYFIPDIGLARVQFIGANAGINDVAISNAGVVSIIGRPDIRTPRIEAAFRLDMVPGLLVDIGAKIPLPLQASQVRVWDPVKLEWTGQDTSQVNWTIQAPYQVSVGARYRIDDIEIIGRVDTKFLGGIEISRANGLSGSANTPKDIEFPFELNVHFWPTYNLGFMIVGLDLGFAWAGEYKQSGTELNKTLDGGFRVGGGVFVRHNLSGTANVQAGLFYSAPTEVNSVKEAGVFSIPVTFDFTF